MKYTSPPDPERYKRTVWEIVRQIPAGRVTTYGYIASLIPPPPGVDGGDYRSWGARWVGGAMAACPADLPWQRVINAQGKISLRPGGGGARQQELLEEEGVLFDDRQRVDLSQYRWDGPGEAWLREHGLVVSQDIEQAG